MGLNKELPAHSQVLSLLLVVGCLCMLAYLGYLIKQTPKVSAADYIQILIFVTIALTLIFAIYAQVKNSQNTDSAAYLNTSIELLNKAYVVLSDGTGGVRCCLLYTSPSPRDLSTSRMPSSA